MTRTALLLALAACSSGNARPAPDREDAGAAAHARTLGDLVGEADVVGSPTHFDARQLDGPVAAYLVTRFGGAGARGQEADVSLLLVWPHRSVRVEAELLEAGVPTPFGTLRAAAPDGPVWPWSRDEPVLLSTSLVDVDAKTHAYVLTRDVHGLTVWVDHGDHDWAPMASVELSATSPVTLSEAPIARDERQPIVVTVEEHVLVGPDDRRLYRASLRIGEHVGPLAHAEGTAAEQDWHMTERPTLGALPPGEVVAWRHYRDDEDYLGMRVLVRLDDELVMWRRGRAIGWQEEARVPLPRGARLDVYLPA